MEKRVLASAAAAPMTALTACGSMPDIGVTQVPTTEAVKTETAKAEEAQPDNSKAEIPAPAADNKAYTLKILTSQIDQSLITQAYTKLADWVKESSDGHLEIRIFSFGRLDNDEDVIEQAIQGAEIAVNTDAVRMGTYVEDIDTLMMRYFADNYEECRKVIETDTLKSWESELADKHGIRVLAFDFYDGLRHLMTNKEVEIPEGLKGLCVRTTGAEVRTESIEVMGGTPIIMAWGKVYNGIQSKALDACEAQNTSTYSSKICEICKYQTETGYFQLPQALMYDESWFKSLFESLQKILVDTAREVGAESAADVLTEAEGYEKKMVETGLTIVKSDVEAFKTAVEPAHGRLGYTELRE